MKKPDIVICSLLALMTAFIAEAGPYLGVSIGKVDYNDSLWSVEDDVNDTGWKLFGGYHFNRYLGLEAAYIDMGKVKYQSTSIETKGFSVDGIGSIPIGPIFSIFGKLGMFRWDQDISYGDQDSDDTGTDLTWGYGFGARFFKNQIGVRVEWERYESDNDADFISLSTSYHF
jgi:OOP family OmpA-OmpF porin